MSDIENLTEDIREIKHKLEQVQTILIEQALTKKELEQIRNDIMILESRVKCNEDSINKIKENQTSKYERIVKVIAERHLDVTVTLDIDTGYVKKGD